VSREIDLEATAAEWVLADFAGGSEDTAPGIADDEVAEVLKRLYVEGFGMLGYDVEPVLPGAELRARLLAGLAGDETQEVEAAAPRRVAAPVTELEETRVPRAAVSRPAPPVRRRRWVGWLAAFLALGAAALGFWALYLQSELDASRARLRRLEVDQGQVESHRQQEIAAARAALDELRGRYALVTAPAVVLYSLRPAPPALQPAARATLYVAPDRRRWQLEVRGLRPESPTQDYQLWFVVDGVRRRGGVFDAVAGQPTVLAGEGFPAGATAVAITLERKGGATIPSGPDVLSAERPVQL